MTTQSYAICPLCEACCGLEINHSEHEVISVRGASADPFSRGYICPKGVAIADLHQDPDRLRTPLIKRNGQHEVATWDEAFAEIETRLLPIIKDHGNHSVASILGNPVAHHYGMAIYAQKWLRELGSPNVFSASTVDQMPKHVANAALYGAWLSNAVPDIERTDLLIILGANPVASNGSMWTIPDFRGQAKALKARGGRIVVIDPRRTETANIADLHLFIKPATDIYLLLAMVNTIYDEGLLRLGRLGDQISGFETLRDAATSFTPEVCSELCGIEAVAIRQLVRDLFTTPRAVLYGRIGTCLQRFGTLNNWLIDVINILTGHLDTEGGAMFPKAPAFAANTKGNAGIGRGLSTGRRHSRVSGAPEVMGEFPVSCLPEEILTEGEGRVRALVTFGTNPVVSSPDGAKVDQALDALEFMLSYDIYLNETTRHADVILPAPSALEISHYDISFSQLSYRNMARYSAPVLTKSDGQPEEWQSILRLIAILKGLGHEADLKALDDDMTRAEIARVAGDMTDAVMAMTKPNTGPERLLDIELRSGPYGDGFGRNPEGLNLTKLMSAKNGIDLGPLMPRMPEILRTPSGKIELAPQTFLDDLKKVKLEENPYEGLLLIGRRDLRSNNSWMHNLPILAKGPNRCTVLIHPDDAKAYRVVDRSKVVLTANGTSITAEAVISDEMMCGVLSLPHGWGHNLSGSDLKLARKNPGVNTNLLINNKERDPLSGNSVLNGIRVQLSLAEA